MAGTFHSYTKKKEKFSISKVFVFLLLCFSRSVTSFYLFTAAHKTGISEQNAHVNLHIIYYIYYIQLHMLAVQNYMHSIYMLTCSQRDRTLYLHELKFIQNSDANAYTLISNVCVMCICICSICSICTICSTISVW